MLSRLALTIKISVLTISAATALSSCQLPPEARQWVSQWAGRMGPPEATVVRRAEAVREGEALFPTPVGFNVPGRASALNDTARLLAGLPAQGRDTFPQVRQSLTWNAHQTKLNNLWKDFTWRHETPIRTWASAQTRDLQASSSLFYPFSGPDFLFAHTFFPHADTIVLCGLEPCEPLPPVSQLSASEIEGGLDGLVTSINTVMQFSFFITKDMRKDLVSTRFRGVLPLILTFMARTGHSIESIDLVKLDGNGNAVLAGAGHTGALIRAVGPDGGMKRVFYFRQDLSNDGLSPGGPFLRFVSSLGSPPAFAKSASYLMHEQGFDVIRDYLLTRTRGIVQDPSGVPYRNLLARGWDVRLFGNYQGTLDMFASHQQPDLIQAYQAGSGQPIDFGIGYLFNSERTCLMVGRPGSAAVSAR